MGSRFPDYPDWVSGFRLEQEYATYRICEAFRSGTRCVLVDGPTGVGKSLIPEMVRRQMDFDKSLYVCSGIELQQQIADDFPYMVDMRGRDNFPTELYPADFNKRGLERISCSDCTHVNESTGCRWCTTKRDCPYELAKIRAINASQVVMNSSYFLTEANHVGRFGHRNREFITIDEADTMDQQMMNLIEIRVPRYVQRQLALEAPVHTTKVESWNVWYESAMSAFDAYVRGVDADAMLEPDEVKFFKRCKSLLEQLRAAGRFDDDWVYVGKGDDEIAFRPVEPAPFGKAKLFSHAKYWLLMSATLLSGDVMAEDLGWPVDEPYEVVYLPSPFPKENRPIRFAPCADMGFKTRQDNVQKLVDGVKAVCKHHEGERVMVHTKTYDTTRALENVRPGHTYKYTERGERHRALQAYKQDPRGVLLAASMERGIDLPDEDCRAVVIAQLPFPYEGDRQIARRIHGTGARGYRWQLMETLRSLVQMAGRGVRHKDDHAVTWVLDSRAPGFVDQCKRRGLVPKWWSEAVQGGPWLRVLGLERKG